MLVGLSLSTLLVKTFSIVNKNRKEIIGITKEDSEINYS